MGNGGMINILATMMISALICLSPYVNSKDDISIMSRIVEAEATGGTYEQKLNVAYCVLARIQSKDFPDSVKDVVFQADQFTPIRDKRYYSVEITTDSIIASLEALWKPEKGHGCTFFCTSDCSSYKRGFHSKLKEVFYDGVHHYFKG